MNSKEATKSASAFNSTGGNFCLKCNAWKGQLGLELTFDDRIIEIELMELRKDLTKEELKEIKKYIDIE